MTSVKKADFAACDSFDKVQKNQTKLLMLRDTSVLSKASDIEFFETEFVSNTSTELLPVHSTNFRSEYRKRDVLSWLQDWAHQCFPFGDKEPFFSSSSSAANSPSSTYIKWNHKTLYSKQLNSLLFQEIRSTNLSRDIILGTEAAQKDSGYLSSHSNTSNDEEWKVLAAYAKELSEFSELNMCRLREQ